MSETPDSTPTTETRKPVADNPQSNNPTTPSEQNTGGFTQADVDRIVSERLKRDREAQETKLKERYGVSDLSEVETLLSAKRKADEAAMSELEKAQAEIEKERQKAQKAIEDLNTLQAQMLANSRQNAFLQAVQDNGGKDGHKLFILVEKLYADDYAAVFGEDGKANETQMKRFIQKLQSEEPAYFGTPGAGSPSTANGISPTSRDVVTELRQQMQANARRTF